MKLSKYYLNTLKEDPKEADVVSQKLMTRAGMIKKLSSGIYTYLPLGYKILRKIENLIRDEMNKSGAVELNMPIIQPAELWIESKRYQKMGKEMWRVKDRNERDFVLGPTHEEVISDIVRSVQISYKNLPFNLYQIQTKIRDERRPRFGLMRSREFLMKDGYSFHENIDSAINEFQNMQNVYKNILNSLNLKFKPVEADSGAMGGNNSIEFHVLADSGEDEIIYCDKCNYAANQEKAYTNYDNVQAKITKFEKVLTPNISKIEDLASFFKVPTTNFIKTLIYKDLVKSKYYKILIRGDLDINEVKLKNILNVEDLALIDDEDFAKLNLAKGFLGPKENDTFYVVADKSILSLDYQIIGSNEKEYHLTGILNNSYRVDRVEDISLVHSGEKCPKCSSTLKSARGIEVGHVFILGDKYSKSMNVKYLNKEGKSNFVEMGCYGMGVSRLMAAIVEQNNDDKGIIWPRKAAPFEVVVIPVNNEAHLRDAEMVYQMLVKAEVDVLLDDRNERVGFKLKDADLIGYPIKIVIGDKIAQEEVEFKLRNGEEKIIKISEIIKNI